jgi:cytoplasmic iron level regulating protein YaaA (DUF328/UPF0246 family)
MLIVISPAKTLDFCDFRNNLPKTTPEFLAKTEILVKLLKQQTPEQLAQTLGVSDSLANLNKKRFEQFGQKKMPAIFAYNGDLYKNLKAREISESALNFAENHLCIISALYGPLRPSDLISEYRLEMSNKLSDLKTSLTDFWTKEINSFLAKNLANHQNKYLLLLSSKEYSAPIKESLLGYPIIDIEFKFKKNGEVKNIPLLAKKARGQMLKFILENQIDSPQEVLQFAKKEYNHQDLLSSERKIIFTKEIL